MLEKSEARTNNSAKQHLLEAILVIKTYAGKVSVRYSSDVHATASYISLRSFSGYHVLGKHFPPFIPSKS